ncbi:hypothetical protein RICGR_0323 [Rickettsiella grylli]|uniref:Uncharacterized protein n=1 Tax=Rickettsiella grylli TaxID=59196 RepID=A8PK68_9COXI|nr:hypothetical protein RICGR_0323 [Rickettsiella grylli]
MNRVYTGMKLKFTENKLKNKKPNSTNKNKVKENCVKFQL